MTTSTLPPPDFTDPFAFFEDADTVPPEWVRELWADLPDAEVTRLERVLDEVRGVVATPGSDGVRIDQLALLARIKSAATAAQLRVIEAFDTSQRALQVARGVQAGRVGRGVADQVALAMGVTSWQGSRLVREARAMVEQMPHTLDRLADGDISERAAEGLVRDTSVLSAEDRGQVDTVMCGPTPRSAGMSEHRLGQATRKLAATLDPEAAEKRDAKARRGRRVTLRPVPWSGPDSMGYLSGLLPIVEAQAVLESLRRGAKAAKASGDDRTQGQVMADLLVERVTGQATAAAVPVEVGLLMTPETLLGLSDEPASLADGTPVPAATARDVAARTDAPRWLRRVFTDPVTGVVVDCDQRRRLFTGKLAQLLRLRDQVCRLPGCSAPIAHLDHVHPAALDGPTAVANGQGLCARHNLVKEAPGWSAAVADERPARHTVVTTTPTGHRYASTAPSARTAPTHTPGSVTP